MKLYNLIFIVSIFRFITPLYDINDLYQNAQCFKKNHELGNKKKTQKSKVCNE